MSSDLLLPSAYHTALSHDPNTASTALTPDGFIPQSNRTIFHDGGVRVQDRDS